MEKRRKDLKIERMFATLGVLMSPSDPSPPPGGPAATPGAALGEALPLLVELVGADLGSLTDAERTDGVLALVKLSGQVDAALAAIVGDWDGRTIWTADGAHSAGGWLAARTELARSKAGSLVHLARDLRSCPHVAEAFAEGVLGRAKVDLLLRARPKVEAVFAAHEAALVAEVRPLTVDHARIVVREWRRLALASIGSDDDGPRPGDPPEDPEADNGFRLSESFDGRFFGDLDLDPVSGAELQQAIEAHVDAQFRDGSAHHGDGISWSRRNAMALCELVRRGSQPGLKHGEARPSVSVILDWAEAAGLAAEGPSEVEARRCRVSDGPPIARSTAERLICEGSVTTVLRRIGLDGQNQVVSVSASSRSATPRQRRALRERDRGCVFPGCHRPVSWTDAHHVDGWGPTQVTVLDRLVLLCRFHHHQVHEGGFRLERSPAGVVTVTRPDGTVLPRPGPGQLCLDPDQGGRPPNPLHPDAGRRPPPTHFRPLTRRQTARERDLAWHADQVDASRADAAEEYARLFALAGAADCDLSDEPEPARLAVRPDLIEPTRAPHGEGPGGAARAGDGPRKEPAALPLGEANGGIGTDEREGAPRS